MNIEQKITDEAAEYVRMNISLAEYPHEISPETIKKWAKKDFSEGAKWMYDWFVDERDIAMNKAVTAQHHADQLAEVLRLEGWVKVEDRTPIAYKSGDFDGKQSDLVLTYDAKRDVYEISCLYEGTLDGSKFKSWYDGNDFETSPPTHWKPLRSPLEQTALTNYENNKTK
jgi:hypothetical protein